MASFIQYLQVNQNYKDLTQYGGISPLVNAKVWVGVADQDPKSTPQEVFIIDAKGQKQVIAQPFFSDDKGNFVNAEDRTAQVIYPQITNDTYSIYIEYVSDGALSIYQRKNVPAGFNAPDYQAKSDLKDITKTDKTGWDVNAPTALSVDLRFKNLEDNVITKNTLSDSIDSKNSQQGASSHAVYNVKNYFSYDNTATEYFTASISRSKLNDYGLMKFTLINGGQGGQAGTINVNDSKPIQSQGGASGEGLIVWLIAEKLPDTIHIEVGQGSAPKADGLNVDAALSPIGSPSKIKFQIKSIDYEISTSQAKAGNLHQDFIHDYQYIPANSGEVGRITFGKNTTEPSTVLALSGLGGQSPVLIEQGKFTEAGAGGNSGVCCTDATVKDKATSGQLGLVILQTSKG